MENPTQLQLFQGLVFLSAGIAAGLVYDVCRALRRCMVRWEMWVDMLYAAAVCAVLFVLGMLVGGGQVRMFMVGSMLLGGIGYSSLCSRLTVPVFVAAVRGIQALLRRLGCVKNVLKNLTNRFFIHTPNYIITNNIPQKSNLIY